MILIPLRQLCGRAGLTRNVTRLRAQLEAEDVEIVEQRSKGTPALFARVSTLPPRLLATALSSGNEAPGQYDDEAWREFDSADPAAQDRAIRRAEAVKIAAPLRAAGVSWPKVTATVNREISPPFSQSAIRKHFAACEGVAPINRAPALLDHYEGGGAVAPMTEEAWHLFLSVVRLSRGKNRLEAHRRVAKRAAAEGWDWPPYPTVNRRYNALPKSERDVIELGPKEAAKRAYKPIRRDKRQLRPLHSGSMDWQRQDFFVEVDGPPFRPWLLAIDDHASRKIVGWVLSETPTAADVVLTGVRAAKRYGPFNQLFADNGMEFAAQAVSGGAKHRYRGNPDSPFLKVPGAFEIMGTRIRFDKPGNPRAKPAERRFGEITKSLAPFMGPAYCGSKRGEVNRSEVIPTTMEFARNAVAQVIAELNARPDRDCDGFPKGASANDVFEEGLKQREQDGDRPQPLTGDQVRRAQLERTRAKVRAHGYIHAFGNVYGFPDADCELVEHIGEEVWIARDPDDPEGPIRVYGEGGGRLICAEVPCMRRYDFTDSAGQVESGRRERAANAGARETDGRLSLLPPKDTMAQIWETVAPTEREAPEPRVVKLKHLPMSSTRTASEVSDAADRPDPDLDEFYRANADRSTKARLATMRGE